MALWEIAAPRRTAAVPKSLRWTNNLAIVALNSVLLRLLFPTAAAGAAVFAAENLWGLFNYLDLERGYKIVLCVILLDLAIYLQHVMFHALPILWRLHRVHHTDLDFDVTTGVRFHPIEIIVSMLIKITVIAALGPPVAAVVIFEILLNASSMFNHGNVRIPRPLDHLLRLFVVTPDMHRVHHSAEEIETNSNFGFNLSIWDRLFGTYRKEPALGHERMIIGLETPREVARCNTLQAMLAMPFTGTVTGYAINQRRRNKE
jgi:sterol desaturase/sphingolipid hydroxylase (fatty acid hydroxylase superfamily)